MGAAPSLEILRQAPYRSLQSGPRQIGLIPITPDFFPSADCVLFRQFYDACNDPSVRYYQRNNVNDEFDLKSIPPIKDSRETLYRRFMHAADKLTFPTNAALKEALRAGEDYKVRPISLAIVFLYDGVQYVADGSVRLEVPFRSHPGSPGCASPAGSATSYPHPPIHVKVIGGMMDITPMQLWDVEDPSTWTRELTPDVPVNIRMFITKSAGDHNMVRVTLLTAYTYRRQFVDLLGEPSVPRLRAVFQTPKTYIPFLCFMRELRDRTAGLFDGPNGPFMWIDDKCLHGDVPSFGASQALDAYARYYVEQVEHHAMQRAAKLAAKAGLPPPPLSCGLATSSSTAMGVSGHPNGSHSEMIKLLAHSTSSGVGDTTVAGASMVGAATNANSSVYGGAFGEPSAREKINYVLRGYIVTPECDIPAYSFQPHEVYVACCESVVRVVDAARVPLWRGPHALPRTLTAEAIAEEKSQAGTMWYPDPGDAKPLSKDSTEDQNGDDGPGEGDVLSDFVVHRGDIIAFYPFSPLEANAPSSNATAAAARIGLSDPHQASDKAASLPTTPAGDVDKPTPALANSNPDSKSAEAVRWLPPRRGLWQKDPDAFVESVLLSLVKDECKNAREADIDDPRWLHDDVLHCPKHDGVFYIWKFRRGEEMFYYGTVPKFANPNRVAGASGSGATGSKSAAASHGRRGAADTTHPTKTDDGGGAGARLLPNSSNTSGNASHLNVAHGGAGNGLLPKFSPPVAGLPSAVTNPTISPPVSHLNIAQSQPYNLFSTAPANPQAFATSNYMVPTGGAQLTPAGLPGYMFTPLPPYAAAQGTSAAAHASPQSGAGPHLIYVMPDANSRVPEPQPLPGPTQVRYEPSPTTAAAAAPAPPSTSQPFAPSLHALWVANSGQTALGGFPIAYGPPRASSHPSSEAGTPHSVTQSPAHTASQQFYKAVGSTSPPQQPSFAPMPSPKRGGTPPTQGSVPSQTAPQLFASTPFTGHGVGNTLPQPPTSLHQFVPATHTQMANALGLHNQLYIPPMPPPQVPAPLPSSPPQNQHFVYQTAPTNMFQQMSGIATATGAPPQQASLYASSPPQQQPQAQSQPQQPMYILLNGQLYQVGNVVNSSGMAQGAFGVGPTASQKPAPLYGSHQEYVQPQTVAYWS